jgi:hypothetical protein
MGFGPGSVCSAQILRLRPAPSATRRDSQTLSNRFDGCYTRCGEEATCALLAPVRQRTDNRSIGDYGYYCWGFMAALPDVLAADGRGEFHN